MSTIHSRGTRHWRRRRTIGRRDWTAGEGLRNRSWTNASIESMTGDDFMLFIDFNFPFHDENLWRRVVETGAHLSPNCAFMVLHEICRPHTRYATSARQQAIYQYWRSCFDHPLVDVMAPVAETMIEHEYATGEQAMAAMRGAAAFPHQANALGLALYSSGQPTAEMKALYEQIVAAWRASGDQGDESSPSPGADQR
jgi:hypothetical protein